MRLKSIKLAGFKSFVDKTTVSFISNMTAVVGPNGCGKSNIIDAVRWVMGESSAKHLRGESMTDVIFNGAAGRQPVGQATIELLFENNEGKLLGEYATFSEISIKRKVTREGVSQYYLNGTKCRRRDVTDIFLGTGMGPRSYAIIEQGMIAKLIESKPEELRVYLEEAAGISKYKERRKETENRMRRTQENLDRLSDIRDELGKQLQHLKRQANAAERFAEYKKEERVIFAKLHTVKWLELDVELQKKNKTITDFEQGIEAAIVEKTLNDNKLTVLKGELEQSQGSLNGLQAKYYQTGAEISALEQEIRFQKSKQLEFEQQFEQLTTELQSSTDLLGVDESLLVDINFELETILPELEELSFQLEELQICIEQNEEELKSWEVDWDKFNTNNASVQQKAELEQAKITQNKQKLSDVTGRLTGLEEAKSTLNQQYSSLDLSSISEEIQTIDECIAESQIIIEDFIPVLDKTNTEYDLLFAKKASHYKELVEMQAVLSSLQTLQQASFGDNSEHEGIWLEKHGFNASRLMESITVEPGWELAVEQVLEHWLMSYQADERGLTSLNLDKLHGLSASITIINSAPNNIYSPQKGRLASKVSGAEALYEVLNRIHICDSNADALNFREVLEAGESYITKDGVWSASDWLRYYLPKKGQDGLVKRAKKIAELEAVVPVMDSDLSKMDVRLEEIKYALKEAQTSKRDQELKLQQLNHNKLRLSSLDSANKAKADQIKFRLERNEDDISEALSQQKLADQNIYNDQDILSKFNEQLDKLREDKSDYIQQRDNIKQSIEQSRKNFNISQSQVHQAELKKQSLLNKRISSTQNVSRLNSEITIRKQKLELLSQSDVSDEDSISQFNLKLEGLLETRLAHEQKLESANQALQNFNQLIRKIENDQIQHQSVVQKSRDDLAEERMATQALKINQQIFDQKIIEDGFSIEAISNGLEEDASESKLNKAIELIASKIQRLGSINLAAIDEFQEQELRKKVLDEQNDDLEGALETLTVAINKIDKETRVRFKETFDQVNEGLQKLFPKIFGGGSAKLTLTDDNLLETGVLIVAQPPGKKNATIHLLSGGEKSLTAIALIFAIFELNPAPFCMLDEVDAPLDDANVGRFANLVKEMSSQVQFIYISHNKVSMEKAEQLMGVTMHEPGVSRLVSVDVEQAVAMVDVN